ncbi:MAG: hypothetical protein ACM35G_13520 [Planctomycetaceae bacterium]
MNRSLRTIALASLLVFAGELGFTARSAPAQGPYGRNGYEDVPFNQGSLFYRPLKPGDPPRRTPGAPRQMYRPYSFAPQGNSYYQPYQVAPYGAWMTRRGRFFRR